MAVAVVVEPQVELVLLVLLAMLVELVELVLQELQAELDHLVQLDRLVHKVTL
jgi:hypothetical protein